MRARTARLSALIHLSPTFGPGMGRPDCVCPFASARWGVFSLFFIRTDAFGCGMVVCVGLVEMPLQLLYLVSWKIVTLSTL
jgi:hypothetical protein